MSSTTDNPSTDSLPAPLEISPKQRRIVKAKIKGKRNPEIGAVEYPNANLVSQRQLVSKELKKPHVAQYLEQSKLQALKEHNITWSRIIAPLNDALGAVKSDLTGDIHVDHNTRMRASKQLAELIQTKDTRNESESAPLINIPNDLDEIQILRAWKSPPQQD